VATFGLDCCGWQRGDFEISGRTAACDCPFVGAAGVVDSGPAAGPSTRKRLRPSCNLVATHRQPPAAGHGGHADETGALTDSRPLVELHRVRAVGPSGVEHGDSVPIVTLHLSWVDVEGGGAELALQVKIWARVPVAPAWRRGAEGFIHRNTEALGAAIARPSATRCFMAAARCSFGSRSSRGVSPSCSATVAIRRLMASSPGSRNPQATGQGLAAGDAGCPGGSCAG